MVADLYPVNVVAIVILRREERVCDERGENDFVILGDDVQAELLVMTAESVGEIDGVAVVRADAEMRAVDVLLKTLVDGKDEADLGAEDVAEALESVVDVRVVRDDAD